MRDSGGGGGNHCKGSGECAAGCLNDYPMWLVVSSQRNQGLAQLSDEITTDAVFSTTSVLMANWLGGGSG